VRFKIDENLPSELKGVFGARGHDADTVMDEGLSARPDVDVWAAANEADRALVTSDLDFADIRKFTPGAHPGIVLYREPQHGLRSVLAGFERALAKHDANDWSRCVVVISADKIRIRRPSDTPKDQD
jgi:predicted nuclease of predicted toxin-antitoxin system